ncbi:MAG: GxxExxY protein [Alphaproteobacteria bacterium]|nr:GxxExxY protein [Alphaproteobacteria bacterium]
MNANAHELIFKDEVYQIVGTAIEVSNTLGSGFLEKPYERALAVELGMRSIPFEQQRQYSILYKGAVVGDYIPDLIVYGKIIAEVKTIERIGSKERSQLLNYLRATGMKVGVILNFGNAKLEWERLVA